MSRTPALQPIELNILSCCAPWHHPHPTEQFVLVTFLAAVIKYLNKSNIRGRGILAHGLGVQSIIAGKTWWERLHRLEAEKKAPPFCFYSGLERFSPTPSPGVVLPTFEAGSSSSLISPLWKHPHRPTQCVSLMPWEFLTPTYRSMT